MPSTPSTKVACCGTSAALGDSSHGETVSSEISVLSRGPFEGEVVKWVRMQGSAESESKMLLGDGRRFSI